MAQYDCPFCGGIITSEKQFGVETCPTCKNVMGMGDLFINQRLLDKARDEEQKAEIDAENAWLRYAESAGEYDPREEMLIANDPWFQEVAERQWQDELVYLAHEDMMDILLEGGM